MLRGRVHDEVALIEERESVVRLHRVSVEHRIAILAFNDQMCLRERRLRVAPLDVRDRADIAHEIALALIHAFIADALAAPLVEDRRPIGERFVAVGDVRQVRIRDLHEIGPLSGVELRLGDHEGDRLPVVTHLPDREHRVVEDDMSVVRRQSCFEEIVAGDHFEHAPMPVSRSAIDRHDARVRAR